MPQHPNAQYKTIKQLRMLGNTPSVPYHDAPLEPPVPEGAASAGPGSLPAPVGNPSSAYPPVAGPPQPVGSTSYYPPVVGR